MVIQISLLCYGIYQIFIGDVSKGLFSITINLSGIVINSITITNIRK